MNDPEFALTLTGATLWLAAVVALVLAIVLATWIQRKVFPANKKEKLVKRLFIGAPFTVFLALIIGVYTVGVASFQPSYESESVSELVAGQPSESIGSPYLTLSYSGSHASFTARDSHGVLTEERVLISRSGFFSPFEDGLWLIIDDATDETAHIEIESCTRTNDSGAEAFKTSCADRKTIHIPRMAVAP